jgi:Xaa-Pro aminopeptidase
MSLDFNRRVTGLQKKMAEEGLDIVVYGSCQNFQYLTGLLIDWRSGIDFESPANNVFVAREGSPILTLDEVFSEQSQKTTIKDVRVLKREGDYGKLVSTVLSDLDVKANRVGLGDHVWGSTVAEISKYAKGASFHRAESLMDNLRMIKDPGEIDRLRKVANLTDKVMENLLPKVKRGVTQGELQLETEFLGRQLGATHVSFPFLAGFVKSGSEKLPPGYYTNACTYPKEKGLEPNTSVAFDFGFVMDGYCSDYGRSFYFGSANEDVEKGYGALHQGLIETVEKMHDGSMRVCDVYPTYEKTLDRLGYGDTLRARLTTQEVGHNIGVECHELPWLNPSYSESLRANMVLALEPKIWRAGEYYLRVEDMVLVGSRKTEFLTNFDRKLFQL